MIFSTFQKMEELVPTILLENKRLEDEIKQLTKEIDELRNIQNELENKYLKMFVENEKLVDVLDVIFHMAKEAVK